MRDEIFERVLKRHRRPRGHGLRARQNGRRFRRLGRYTLLLFGLGRNDRLRHGKFVFDHVAAVEVAYPVKHDDGKHRHKYIVEQRDKKARNTHCPQRSLQKPDEQLYERAYQQRRKQFSENAFTRKQLERCRRRVAETVAVNEHDGRPEYHGRYYHDVHEEHRDGYHRYNGERRALGKARRAAYSLREQYEPEQHEPPYDGEHAHGEHREEHREYRVVEELFGIGERQLARAEMPVHRRGQKRRGHYLQRRYQDDGPQILPRIAEKYAECLFYGHVRMIVVRGDERHLPIRRRQKACDDGRDQHDERGQPEILPQV